MAKADLCGWIPFSNEQSAAGIEHGAEGEGT